MNQTKTFSQQAIAPTVFGRSVDPIPTRGAFLDSVASYLRTYYLTSFYDLPTFSLCGASKALNLKFTNSPLVKSFWQFFALALNRKTESQSEKL